MGIREQSSSRRVRVLGGDGTPTGTVVEGLSAFEVERVSSIATLTPATAAAVVVVAPALGVSPSTAVERVRRLHGETPVVVATNDVTATRADAVVPIDADDAGRIVRRVVDGERVERTGRRVGRAVSLLPEFDERADLEAVCDRLADEVGYDTAWVVRVDEAEASVVPVVAAGVPTSALRTVDAGADDPWARALRTGDSVVDADGNYTVAVPFGDRCLVCTTDTAVGDAEVSALEAVLGSLRPANGGRSRYALLGDAIAHEVNNQLDVARVHLDLADGDERLSRVEAALERIDDVVEEVNVLVSRELSVEEVPLGDVAEDVWSGVSTNGATLKVGDGTVEADERLLRLLLANLFRNAIQHGGEDVNVEVTPLAATGFYVADDGDGLATAASERLFEWGWSAEEGTGIGLALVSLVVDRHGWDVEHRDVGGARFEFRPG